MAKTVRIVANFFHDFIPAPPRVAGPRTVCEGNRLLFIFFIDGADRLDRCACHGNVIVSANRL
jgi:hypothetical protein